MLLETTPKSTKTHHPTIRRASQKTAITMWDLAVWTYRDQKAHKDVIASYTVGYSSLSSTGRVGRVCQLGGFISGGGPRMSHCDDDALAVHSVVGYMPSEMRSLIIRTAATASPPEWSPMVPAFKVVPVKGRKLKKYDNGLYDEDGGLLGHYKAIFAASDGHGPVIGCEIDYAGYAPDRAAQSASWARELYQSWYGALHGLWERFAGDDGMRRWIVTGIGAEAAPWASVRA
jgi:hypothetical protein